MSFFGSDFFKEPHFKAPFYGGAFFEESYFEDTTIAHPNDAEVSSGLESIVTVNRDITGSLDVGDYTITADGVDVPVTGASYVGKTITLVNDAISSGQVCKLWMRANDANNTGVVDGYPMTNSVALALVLPVFQDMTIPELRAYAHNLGIDIHGIHGKNNIIAAIEAWHQG